MTDTPTKPTLTLFPGAAMKTVDGIAALYQRITGKEMSAEGRAYAAETLGKPKPDEPKA